MLAELGIPLLHVCEVEAWWVGNGVEVLFRLIFSLLVIVLSLSPHCFEWVTAILWEPQSVDEW